MKKLIRILATLMILFSYTNIHASYTVDKNTNKLVYNFFKKIEKKYNQEKEIIFLKNINKKIIKLLNKQNINKKKKKILTDIFYLFNEKIFKIKVNINKQNNLQKIIEIKEINNIKNEIIKINNLNYIRNTNNKVIKITNKQEFYENNEIKKINFKNYFLVSSKNYYRFNDKKGLFLLTEKGLRFVDNYTIENKIKYSNSNKYFKNFISYKDKTFYETGNYYTYNFTNYKFINDKYGFYINDLKAFNIDPEKSIIYLSKNNKYNFITNFTKVKLINGDIIYGIVDKENFLKDLVNDKLYITSDTDKYFIKLKDEVKKITIGKNNDEKIKIIYNFIIKKLNYTQNLKLEDKKIFSGILAFKNGDGVCEAYAKLMSYSLKFAGIYDVEVLRGDVIDSNDFPKIGHAWVEIGNKYYDPTFDDPIGGKEKKNITDYSYFALPKDLFYTNRFDYGNTPENLKNTTLNYRRLLVSKNLAKLSDKYKAQKYKLLELINFKLKNNIKISENISIEDAKKIIDFYEVTEKNSGEIIFYKNGQKKNIKKLQYYEITDKNLGQVLKQLNYKTEGLYIFKWNKSGNIYYRLGFNVEIK